jgi:hypothetical protein
MIGGLSGCLAPGERRMASHENSGDRFGIQSGEGRDNGPAGGAFVVVVDLGGREMFSYGDGAVKVISVGGAKTGDLTSGLGPGGGCARMSVDDAAD